MMLFCSMLAGIAAFPKSYAAAGAELEWEFSTNTEGWIAWSDMSSLMWQTGGYAGANILGMDPHMKSPDNLSADITGKNLFKVRIKNNTSSTLAQIFFITDDDQVWDDSKYKDFAIVPNSDYIEYIIDMSAVPEWTGTLKQIRFDPAQGAPSGSFSMDYIRIQEPEQVIEKRIAAYFPFWHLDQNWEFTSDTEGWTGVNDVLNFHWQSGGYVGGTIAGNDPQIMSPSNLGVDISSKPVIKIKLKNNSLAELAQIFFITDNDQIWNDAKHKDFPIIANSGYTEYTIDMSTVAGWTGNLKQLRIDPGHGVSSGSFSIEYIRILDSFTYHENNIPFDKVTHLFHAFIGVKSDGSLDVDPKFLNPDLIADAHAAGVKVIVSIANYLDAIQDVVANPVLRSNLVTNIETFIRTNGYDGVDIDWEYPANAADRTNFTLLMKEIRTKFDSSAAPAPTWSTSIAMNGYDGWAQWIDLDQMDSSLTFINLMAYDMAGPWSGLSGHNAPLYQGTSPYTGLNTKAYLDYLINDRGFVASKINVGMAYYGWKFDNSTALYDNCGGNCSNGGPAYYKEIVSLIGNGWTRHWDNSTKSPYLLKDNGTGLISYDDPISIDEKVSYVLGTRGVGGVFAWEIAYDYLNDGSQPLMDALYAAAVRYNPSTNP